MQTVTLQIEVQFGVELDNAQATELLADYVRQVGQHTTAQKVNGIVLEGAVPEPNGVVFTMPKILGRADFEQGSLRTYPVE